MKGLDHPSAVESAGSAKSRCEATDLGKIIRVVNMVVNDERRWPMNIRDQLLVDRFGLIRKCIVRGCFESRHLRFHNKERVVAISGSLILSHSPFSALNVSGFGED